MAAFFIWYYQRKGRWFRDSGLSAWPSVPLASSCVGNHPTSSDFVRQFFRRNKFQDLSQSRNEADIEEESKKDWAVTTTHSQHVIHALDFLFGNPIFSGTHFVERSGIPAPTARRILKLCADNGLLRQLPAGSGRRQQKTPAVSD